MALRHALLPYLHQLDFEEGFARRWFPRGRSVPIVLDPEVSFGAPVVAGTGIQTATLSGMIEAGETAESVAWWYRLGIPLVDAAVHFERSLSAA